MHRSGRRARGVVWSADLSFRLRPLPTLPTDASAPPKTYLRPLHVERTLFPGEMRHTTNLTLLAVRRRSEALTCQRLERALFTSTERPSRVRTGSGWGEAPTSWRVTGESHQSVTAAVEGPLTEAALGAPVDDPAGSSAMLARSLVRNSATPQLRNSAARMAVDCALYDLAAQAR